MQTLPQVKDRADAVLTLCIEECYASAKACAACADACLDEGAVRQLRQCIRLSLFCANVCTATAQAASGGRHSSVELVVRMLDACAAATSAENISPADWNRSEGRARIARRITSSTSGAMLGTHFRGGAGELKSGNTSCSSNGK